jgi:hypothetical protein
VVLCAASLDNAASRRQRSQVALHTQQFAPVSGPVDRSRHVRFPLDSFSFGGTRRVDTREYFYDF